MTESALSTEAAPRLNRRQAAKVRTRQKVLDAARSLFAERGYEPATIRDIAKGAGMSTGAVFANFQDKAELFEAVLTEDMSRLAEVVEAGAPEGEPVRQRLLGARMGRSRPVGPYGQADRRHPGRGPVGQIGRLSLFRAPFRPARARRRRAFVRLGPGLASDREKTVR